MKALLIIDVQNDFIPGGSLEVPEGNVIMPVINRVQNKFDLVIATQDWHPENHSSFASNHPGNKPYDIIVLNGMKQILWPDHCVQGSKGADFPSELEIRKIAAVFRKGMNHEIDSYSSFYDNGHLVSTGLSGYLKDKGITELFFCGLAGDICVYYSILDSLKEGFSSTLIEDAACPLNREKFEKIKNELLKMGVRVVNSNDIL
jgi:nicotinamidase/pyrazinamidase